MVSATAEPEENILLVRDLNQVPLLPMRGERYLKNISSQEKILRFPLEYCSSVKYSLKNCKLLDLSKTQATKPNNNKFCKIELFSAYPSSKVTAKQLFGKHLFIQNFFC